MNDTSTTGAAPVRAATPTGAARLRRGPLLLVLAVAFGAYALTYFSTLFAIVGIWRNDVAYTHGFLILPISLWLVWKKRQQLQNVAFRPAWSGVLLLVGLVALWMVAKAAGAQVVEQFAVVAMMPSLVLAVLGLAVATTLAFPLAFILFMVPFGQGLLPWMMQITADVSTWALHLTGLPVYRSHMYLTIPYGQFEIAKACGGLKYVITGLVLGALYSYLTYRTWWKRALSMLVFVVVPILANALRVYVIVIVSYMTKFRFGPGAEHVEFGRALFILVMVVLFVVGRRWAEDHLPVAARPTPATVDLPDMVASAWLPALVAVLVVLLGPLYLTSAITDANNRLQAAHIEPKMPAASGEWQGPFRDRTVWRPEYRNTLLEDAAAYETASGPSIEIFVGVYGIGATSGGEMINYGNVLSLREHESLVQDSTRLITAPDIDSFSVREVVIADQRGTYLVWQWFMVGDARLSNPFAVKAHEAMALLGRSAHSERVITVATQHGADAEERLQGFVSTYAQCVASGFDRQSCGS